MQWAHSSSYCGCLLGFCETAMFFLPHAEALRKANHTDLWSKHDCWHDLAIAGLLANLRPFSASTHQASSSILKIDKYKNGALFSKATLFGSPRKDKKGIAEKVGEALNHGAARSYTKSSLIICSAMGKAPGFRLKSYLPIEKVVANSVVWCFMSPLTNFTPFFC